MPSIASDNLAMLIDADNAQASVITELLAEVARYGTATVKRAYGDWTTPNLAGWKDVLHVDAIQPIQQFRYTTGKNATDSALIIEAMDLLHGGKVDGFCLVSSDSDFTRLATRIREAGLSVFGFGEQKTPKPFVAACDKFIFTEILRQPAPGSATEVPSQTALKPLITSAIAAAAQDDGWALLAVVGGLVSKADSSFDARNYGFKKLGELVKAQAYLEVKSTPSVEGSQITKLSVRIKES
ncbi:MAG: Maebl [Betaproteobacteria bacterium]|nr:Maebl [Betaproteobacteria bacterium]